MGNSEKTKIRMQSFCEKLPRSSYSIYGWLDEPSIRAKPNHFIIDVGTNELNSNRPPDEIAKAIIDFASEMKSEKSDISISSIIMRADKPELNKKGSEVNHHLFTSFITAKKLKQVIWIVVDFI